jgi:hypothetical protein
LHFIITLLLGLSPIAVGAQDTAVGSLLSPEERRVLAVEDEYVVAEVNRDEAALERLLDDRFQYNRSNGTTWGKEDYIQNIMHLSMVGQTISERSILLEDDIALVFGTAELRFEGEGGEESVSTLRYTATYVNREGHWRMLAVQLQKRAAS